MWTIGSVCGATVETVVYGIILTLVFTVGVTSSSLAIYELRISFGLRPRSAQILIISLKVYRKYRIFI